jgi:zinc transport system substrate-binding protein
MHIFSIQRNRDSDNNNNNNPQAGNCLSKFARFFDNPQAGNCLSKLARFFDNPQASNCLSKFARFFVPPSARAAKDDIDAIVPYFRLRRVPLLAAFAVIFVLSGFGLASCGGGRADSSSGSGVGSGAGASAGSGAESGRLTIVASIFPEYDFARAVSGGLADIELLIDPGSSIHSYDPSPSDIQVIQNADVFLYVGGESDVWADRILDSLDTEDMRIVCLMDRVNAVEEELKEGMMPEEEEAEAGGSEADAAEEEGPELDEHVWTSPGNAIILIDAIADAICAADPVNETAYRANAAAYKAEIEEVDRQIAEVVATAKRQTIVVADKFPLRYFTDHYGLDYAAAFPGCSDQADCGAETIAYLIDTVAEDNLPYVYHVELSNQNVAKAIAEQTGAGILLLNSCENITREDFERGVTYVDLMRVNLENLEKGLN